MTPKHCYLVMTPAFHTNAPADVKSVLLVAHYKGVIMTFYFFGCWDFCILFSNFVKSGNIEELKCLKIIFTQVPFFPNDRKTDAFKELNLGKRVCKFWY